MIKFVCGGCGERLSVPDQYAGRKGACPTCRFVNRIPLRGLVQTQPFVAAGRDAARPAAEPTSQAVDSTARGQASATAPPAREAPVEAEATLTPLGLPGSAAAERADLVLPDRIPDAKGTRAFAAKAAEDSPRRQAAANAPARRVEPRARRERSLPRPLKIALLALAAAAFVGLLYLALYFALRMAVPMR